jgi:hypothetical protein
MALNNSPPLGTHPWRRRRLFVASLWLRAVFENHCHDVTDVRLKLTSQSTELLPTIGNPLIPFCVPAI